MSELIKDIKKFFYDKVKRTNFLSRHGFYRNMSDEEFLKMQFKNCLRL